MATQTSSAVFAGPRDRESFLDAQKRNRRATWRLSVVSAFATVVMGIPLALTVTPLLYAAGLIIADVVNIWMPLPQSFWQQSNELARYGLTAFKWMTGGAMPNPNALAVGVAVLLLPGAILSVALWLGINSLFRRAGVGGALLALKAREPNPSELKELQLADVVQEMAIAAGLPAPKIMLIDSPAANAAAIGTSPADARIVITRGMLERLTRDELEGALAHLIASVGNGDLKIAFRVTGVFETCGLLVALINSPFGPRSRHTLWRIVRFGLRPKGNGESDAAEAAAVADLLSGGTELATDDIDDLFDTTSKKKSILRSIRNFLLFPIFFTNAAIKLSLWFFSFSMLQPSVALLWRKRIYLADAAAVQLTRNPDGLAEALRKLNSDRAPVPGAAWASHLFLVNPAGSDRMNDPKEDNTRQQMLAQMWAASASQPEQTAGSAFPGRAGAPFSIEEVMATGRAAMAGDPQARARMMAFRQAAATALGKNADELPNFEDIAAAQHGDKAAIARLAQFSQKMKGREASSSDSRAASENASSGFAGFHPSLKRRLKRLDRMGAHVELEADDHKTWIVVAALALLLGPFALAALALLLLLIAIMMMASLAFMAIWMAFIHQIFVTFLHH
ncbi:MAG TPA: M48 family metalloprotease [Candidatus Acidoferrales bacterium]|nr:M48 family metalloprotease [Candidatus Acidoferrales bacterium]